MTNVKGLSRNPVGVQGIVAIGGGFNETQQVLKLNLSACSVDGSEGAFRVAQIIGFHHQLEWLDISAIPLGLKGGDKLLENLLEQRNLTHLECRCCGIYRIFNKLISEKLLFSIPTDSYRSH